MRYNIGIDLAKRKHSAAVIRGDGERLLLGFEFGNDEEGFASLLAKLAEVGAECDGSGVCLEATGHYGRNLVAFLEAHGYAIYEAPTCPSAARLISGGTYGLLLTAPG